jgi:hypothetical protein
MFMAESAMCLSSGPGIRKYRETETIFELSSTAIEKRFPAADRRA